VTTTPLGVKAERMRVHREADPRNAWDIRLRHHYGITADQYDAMAAAQDNRCAICRTDTPGGKGRWHVDHDHACCDSRRSCGGCIRGLLCLRCNSGLGFLRDDAGLLRAALTYLEKTHVPKRLPDEGSPELG
jgi:hypothetical protein